MLKALLLRLFILLGLFQVASSEIRPFNSLLDPSVGVQKKISFRMNKTTFILLQYLGLPLVWTQSKYITYQEGFLITPGYIDLTVLRFSAVPGMALEDDIFVDEDDEDDQTDNDDKDRRLEDDDSYRMEGSSVDIAVFHLVSLC